MFPFRAVFHMNSSIWSIVPLFFYRKSMVFVENNENTMILVLQVHIANAKNIEKTIIKPTFWNRTASFPMAPSPQKVLKPAVFSYKMNSILTSFGSIGVHLALRFCMLQDPYWCSLIHWGAFSLTFLHAPGPMLGRFGSMGCI